MRTFDLTILGSSSATPTSNRNPSAQLVNLYDRLFLIDCGEGTQVQLRKFKIKFQRINHIFISHLHGDHYFGLPGLLSSMSLLGRNIDLHLYGPPALKEIIDLNYKYSDTHLNYSLIFHPIDASKQEVLFEDERVMIKTIVLNHRIPCTGFLFTEKSAIDSYLKTSLLENYRTHSYAYCSDTCFDNNVIEQIKDTTVLYHEATFMEDRIERAIKTFHSTSKQAATVALRGGVSKLILGHFSARYSNLEPLLLEAKEIFPNSYLAIEGEKIKIE